MGQNQVVFRHPIIHFPTSLGVSECSGACERREQCKASEWVRGAGGWANEGLNDPVLTSWFFAALDHFGVLRLAWFVWKPVNLRCRSWKTRDLLIEIPSKCDWENCSASVWTFNRWPGKTQQLEIEQKQNRKANAFIVHNTISNAVYL